MKNMQMRLMFGAMVVLSVVPSAVRAAEEYEATPVEIVQDEDFGGVVFNASGTRNLFPSLSSPRTFADWPAFFKFMITTLHATPIEQDGMFAGISLNASMTGEAFRITELGETQRIGCDPVGEWLVGEFGYFLVGGEKVFVHARPCWEWASDYLAAKMKPGFRLVDAGGGCSANGYCVANATWSGGIPLFHQVWGGTAFQARSEVRCRRVPFPYGGGIMLCTQVSTSNIALQSSALLTNEFGNFVVDSRSKGAANVSRVDVELIEWKFPWSKGGLVWRSAGVCGITQGVAFQSSQTEAAAASSSEAVTQFASAVRSTCR